MKYLIQQKIGTLAENAVNVAKSDPSFTVDDITFYQWEFNHRDGWLGDAWLAEATIDAENFSDAYRQFRAKLVRIVPRIAFVGQAYTEFGNQPFLILKEGSDIAYFYDILDRRHVGLMFQEDEEAALRALIDNHEVSDEFFLYWSDAVNTIGYSPKLLVMFSAIEALAKKPNGKKDYGKIEAILGPELKQEIFTPTTGLRHRLTHGEHFSVNDFSKNYVEEIHKKIVQYFNQEILGSKLITEDVTGPQRHLFGNKELGRYFIKAKKTGAQLRLREVLKNFDDAGEDRLRPTDYDLERDPKNY
jgi:hypothetical protein